MPKVSVIIPVYNAGEHLEECLRSVLGQSLKDIEVVVIDDGSSDSSGDIMRHYVALDPRICLSMQENAGAGAARNAGLRRATGDFVAFMDADDWYPAEYTLERLYNAAIQNGVSVAGGSFSIWEKDKMQNRFSGNMSGYTFYKDELLDYRDYQYDYGYHRFIYRRDMLIEGNICFPAYKRYQDPPFFVRALLAAEKFFAMRDVVYCYRAGHQALQWNDEKIIDLVLGLTDILKISRENELEKLHALTVSRIEAEYAGILLLGIRRQNRQLISLLMQANLLIDPALLEKAGVSCPSPIVMAPIMEALAAYQNQAQAISPAMEKLSALEAELTAIKHSAGYRLCNGLLWLPRTLKQLALKQKFRSHN